MSWRRVDEVAAGGQNGATAVPLTSQIGGRFIQGGDAENGGARRETRAGVGCAGEDQARMSA